MKLCDLHTHTTASDGSDSPEELVQLASKTGLAAIAITDHDTTAALKPGAAAAMDAGVEFIPGVELSCSFPKGNMHLLGYFIDQNSSELQSVIEKVQAARAERNPRILKMLGKMGLPVSMEEINRISHGGQVGRPHIARIMVEKGYVKSVSQAFDRYLRKGGPAYAPKSILSPEDAIQTVRRAGGIPVLAHPFSLQAKDAEELEGMVTALKDAGLMGIECYYSEHDKAFTALCLDIASRYGLVATGGSDYHGKAKPYIRLGVGKGNLRIPYSCVEALKAARNAL